MLLAPVLFLFVSSVKFVSGADWCYQSQFSCNHTCTDPEEWGMISQNCNGRAQSPVNIVTRKLQRDERLNCFVFTGYQEIFHSNLTNNGHSVQLNLPSSIKIKNANLPATYKALQLHLHWGEDGGPGSEHTIDGERFPMEMHIVHIKEEYNSLSQAVKDPTGVAVLGFFFEESTSDNKKFAPLINALKNLTQPSSIMTLESVSLEMFTLPEKNMTKYFRYDGSLTTPDCQQAVIWTLFENTILLSSNQLKAFSKLRFADKKPMVNNYRPVQPLNGRVVYYSRGHVVLVSAGLLVMSVLMSSALSLDTTA
ncbi:carbonic anhydrase 4b [Chaetodon trifascialis]|uniref:carbonic anhydrase 4b n=1 Tax=Chaetodon trifascialis TaxID=109706 RepID=UPI003994B905